MPRSHLRLGLDSICRDIMSPDTMVYGEPGRYPLTIKSMLQRPMQKWLRLSKMKADRLSRQCCAEAKSEQKWTRDFIFYCWMVVTQTIIFFYWTNLKRLQNYFKQARGKKRASFLLNSPQDSIHCENNLNYVIIKKFRDDFVGFRLGIKGLYTNRRDADKFLIILYWKCQKKRSLLNSRPQMPSTDGNVCSSIHDPANDGRAWNEENQGGSSFLSP